MEATLAQLDGLAETQQSEAEALRLQAVDDLRLAAHTAGVALSGDADA